MIWLNKRGFPHRCDNHPTTSLQYSLNNNDTFISGRLTEMSRLLYICRFQVKSIQPEGIEIDIQRINLLQELDSYTKAGSKVQYSTL